MTPRKRLFDEAAFLDLRSKLSLDLTKRMLGKEAYSPTQLDYEAIENAEADFIDSEISRNVHEALDEISAIDIQGDPNDAIRLIEEIKSRYPAKKEKV